MTFGDTRLPERFWAKVSPEPNSGCWLWVGSSHPEGYGQLRYGKRQAYAHRLALDLGHSKTPGMTVDHLCRTKACCNPEHLELVTRRENAIRGNVHTNGDNHRRKTHCPQGHPYDASNTYRYRGERHCKACGRARQCRNRTR
jgi:hypothetical protein